MGNVVASTAITGDYPEIVSAGFYDSEGGEHITMDGIGITVVRVKNVDPKKDVATGYNIRTGVPAMNSIATYEQLFTQKIENSDVNNFTYYGSIRLDRDVHGLMQVQAFADRGFGA